MAVIPAGASSTPQTRAPLAAPRLLFIDNLRWTMILLVVSMHAAVTYSSVGRWYYMEKPQPAGLELLVFLTYQAFLQAFFMGFLFFIAGYFVPGAFDKKGPGRFLRDRAIRLGLPTLLYVFAIEPVNGYLAGYRHAASPGAVFHQYWRYLASGGFLEGTGPLWFCVALLIFCCAYALIRAGRGTKPSAPAEGLLPGHRDVCVLIGLMATATFLVRTVQPMGTAIYNMQLCYFSQYVLLFAMGIQAYRKSWLLRLPHQFGVRWLVAGLGGGTLLFAALLSSGGTSQGDLKAYNGGWHWQSAALSLWESLVCVGVCLGLMVLFRDGFSGQGRLARFLSANAFAIYVFHPPVLIGVTRALRAFAAPPLFKFGIATAIAWGITGLLAAAVFRRIPGLRRILA